MLDKQHAQKEKRLKEDIKKEREDIKKEREKVNARMNVTCHREAELRAYDALKSVYGELVGRTRVLEKTSAVVEVSAVEAVDVAHENERIARVHERSAGVKLKQEQVEMKKAREKHQLQLDTERAKHLSKEDQIKAEAKKARAKQKSAEEREQGEGGARGGGEACIRGEAAVEEGAQCAH